MKYNEFVSRLSGNAEAELVFFFGDQKIRSDYHITEVLHAQVSSIDCGKSVSRWNESVFQLYEPKIEKDDRHMSSKKALQILDKSQKIIGIDKDGEELIVTAAGTTTQCKPALRTASGCC